MAQKKIDGFDNFEFFPKSKIAHITAKFIIIKTIVNANAIGENKSGPTDPGIIYENMLNTLRILYGKVELPHNFVFNGNMEANPV